VDAIARQDPAIEHVVVDDHSTDNSVDVIRTSLDEAPHRKFVQHRPNLGLSATLNTALEAAGGTWVSWLNADDAYHGDGLLRALDVARDSPLNVGFLYGDVAAIDENSQRLDVIRLYRGAALCMRFGWSPLYPPSVLFRRSFLPAGFDTRFRLLVDLDAYFTILSHGRARYLPFIIGQFRMHPGQQSAISRPTDADEWRYLAEKHSCRFKDGPSRLGHNIQRLLKLVQLKYGLPT
jgi:glycosyltransferase involved in cell wall biosynthesis